MGAWIEIPTPSEPKFALVSHPTMGAWIEIPFVGKVPAENPSRTPRWVRGLKSTPTGFSLIAPVVAPHDGCVD